MFFDETISGPMAVEVVVSDTLLADGVASVAGEARVLNGPMPAVQVSVLDAEGALVAGTTTGLDGRFSLAVPHRPGLRLRVGGPQYRTWERDLDAVLDAP
ncbi:hypothetical protein [Rubrivirga litoralis]|uniref:Carboxypeptidase regulatory-like domain-containing protein n=1 Tax=Rubrivirga litoralis TaxID=3075598 RepID=A0ABU3BQ51_9BACT|nr:hypothetical protein [Rubrivirga sp. F394]MDT0631405.1 hypothetical protein [Rubrivirga sp. F394]